jgi:hypothetical protein
MSYNPSSWEFNVDEKGDKIYEDHILNVIQQNLLTLSSLIDDIRSDANINILYVQNWANCKTVKDPTVQIIALFTSKIIEGLGVIFKAGTGAAIIATIACKIISGLITHFGNPQSKDTYNQLQSVASDLKLSIDKYCFLIQEKIAFWLDNLKTEWNTILESPGAKYPEFKGEVKLSDMAVDKFLPKKGSTDYVYCREKMNEFSTYEAAKVLMPVRWKIRTHRAFPADGVSNFLSGWQVSFYKVRGKGSWDSWRKSSEFPKIPSNLYDDIEGPLDYIEKGDNAHSQRFMSWYSSYRDYSWSDGSKYEESRQYNGTRWMGFSGKNNPEIVNETNLNKGTSFLDLIDDILNGVYNSYGDWIAKNSIPNEPSYYLWYKTKRKNEPEIINDRRVWTLMSDDACQDWSYDSNSIFTWGRAYRGITLHHYTLVDENGNYAPRELCRWLFKDNGHGKFNNDDGVSTMEDIYHKWGINFE